jgi:hypothetical protein
LRRIRTAKLCTSTSALALVLLFSGCGGTKRPVSYVDITNRLHGFQPARYVGKAFLTQRDFSTYVRHASPGIGKLPAIDWAHREAILISTGPRSSTGFALRIVRVFETSSHVVVTAHEVTPTLGESVVARVTYPFRLITIPRTTLPLHVHWPGRP